MLKFITVFIILLISSIPVNAQATTEGYRQLWSQPMDPFHVIGNIYYVGTSGISSHIIVTPEGLILIDTGTTYMEPILQNNIEKLGHKMTDIKYILSSHAHWDHVEGLAAMKKITGARIVALGEDAKSIASGVDTSAGGYDGWEPVKVDQTIADGEIISLGGTTFTAHLTAGHTKGTTSWTTTIQNEGKSYDVIFVGGTSINTGVSLLDNEGHPSIAEDYANTFQFLNSLKPDVFIAQHPFLYGMEEKRQALSNKAEQNPFINPDEYKAFIALEEGKYIIQLNRERAAQ